MPINYEQIVQAYEHYIGIIDDKIEQINEWLAQGQIEIARQITAGLHLHTIYGLQNTIDEIIVQLENELPEDRLMELEIFRNEHGDGQFEDYLTHRPTEFNTATAILMLHAANNYLFGLGEDLATDINLILREHATATTAETAEEDPLPEIATVVTDGHNDTAIQGTADNVPEEVGLPTSIEVVGVLPLDWIF